MSRLQDYQKKQARKQFLWVAIILAFLSIFVIKLGVPFIIGGSSSLGSKFVRRTDVVEDPNANDIRITLDPVAQATSSAERVLSGTTENVDELIVFINGARIQSERVSDGDFELITDGLSKGKNEIILQGKNTALGRIKKADVIVVDYLSEKPQLEISSPQPDSTTFENAVDVVGATNDPANTVRVNGQPVVANAKGSFSHSLRLQTGDNTVTVIAVNEAGLETKVEFKIKREK